MVSRRRVLVTAGGVLGLLVLAGVGAILVFGLSRDLRAKAQLRERDLELRALYAKDPFPSTNNLSGERKNLKDLEVELGRLLEAMSHGQVEPEEQSPERFISQFHETRRRLERLAAANGVTLTPKDDFAFGFDRHMAGNPPAHPDVRRLTQQLLIVEALCNELYAARITVLRGIGREEFEQSLNGDEAGGDAARPVARSARRRGAEVATVMNVKNPDAGLIPDKALYGTWRFTMEFTAKEMALIDVLNRLARCDTFAAVTRVEVQGDPRVLTAVVDQAGRGEKTGGKQPSPAATTVAEPAGQRLLAGLDTLLTVRMSVDVYQFRKATAAGVAAKAKTAAGG